ncbi:MAG: lysophospholipase [Bacteroidota bacterium]
MQAKELTWTTPDQVQLHVKHWSLQQPKVLLCLVHGLGEHCGRYQHLAEYFAQAGVATLSYDQRGHGHSSGKRGHVTNYDCLLNDVELLLQKGEELYPGVPQILYGHSMGGNVVLSYVLRRRPALAATITTGAWIQLTKQPPAIQVAFGRLMRSIFPAFTQPSKLDPSHISTVAAEVERYVADPLIHSRISSATGIDVIGAGQWLYDHQGEAPMPMLIMHGGADLITDPAASRRLAERLSGPVSYKEWPGMYHEIHHEAEPKAVFDFTLNWLKKYISL